MRGERTGNSGQRSAKAARQSVLSTRYLVLALAFALVAQPTLATEQDDERVEQFLNRLGLVDLQTLHLEHVLERQTEAASREKLAQRLADIYASQLLVHSGNKAKYDEVLTKIDLLTKSAPTAKTPALEVMLLQADYNRAEGLIGEWMADRSQDASLKEASSILSRIAPELTRLQKGLNDRAEELIEQFESTESGPEQDAKAQELKRLQPVAGRATYFAAWSNYYLGLTQESATAYQKGRAIFRDLFGLGDDYTDEEVEYLGLGSIWRARALIGLSLTEAALNAPANSAICFKWLEDGSVPPQVRQQVPYWRLQALLNTKQFAAAAAFAKAHVAAFDDRASQDRVSFCISLIQAAYGGGQPELGTIGLGGLIKIGQRGTARQLMEKYQVEVDANAGFYLVWLRAQQLFEKAEASKKGEDYQAAKDAYIMAVASSNEVDDLSAVGQCNNQFAWVYRRLDEHAAAGDKFRFASERLTLAKDRQAVDSAWMAFVSYHTAAKDDPKLKQKAIDALNTIKREFPGHEYAKKADYHIAKLRQGTSPEETMRSLERVQRDSPDYVSARFEICTLRHQKWSKAADNEKSELARQLLADVQTFLGATPPGEEVARRAKVLLIAADVHLKNGDVNAAQGQVQQASAYINGIPESSSTLPEYHYRALQVAQRRDDTPTQRDHADWIVKNARGSRYELPAVIVMARVVDQEAAGENPSKTSLQQAFGIYNRLVEILGSSPEAISASRNAQVANSKLAHYAYLLGRHQQAAARLDDLLAAGNAKDRSYLRRAGLSHFQAGNYAAALGPWRTLLRGVAKGSDEWFEAKYHQLACLFKMDATKAKQVFEQFKLLYPDLGGAKWRDKFASLEE